MNTKHIHSSSSSPTYSQQLLYHQQQQHNHNDQSQQQYQQQQTTQQQLQLAQSRRAVLKLHSRLYKQLQQPQPEHQHLHQQLNQQQRISSYDDNLCSSVNWQMENNNSNVNNSNARFGNKKSSSRLTSTQLYQSLYQPLYQSLQQYMNQIHQSYFCIISKLQKKITRLESTLQQFVITRIKRERYNNTKWFQKQVMYEREINQLKQQLYQLQRQKLSNFKKQTQKQSQQQQQEQQQQQQKSLLQGIDDELQQWQNNKLLQINKFINSSVGNVDSRQANKCVSRCQQSMMPVTLRNQTTKQQTIKDINKLNITKNANINSNNKKPNNQYQHQYKQQYKLSTMNTPKSITNILQHNNIYKKLSNPQQILKVDEQLLSQLSNSNQIQQESTNKKCYKQQLLSKPYFSIIKDQQQNQQQILEDKLNIFQSQHQYQYQQQQQQQESILARQQSQVEEFNYNIGFSNNNNLNNNKNVFKNTVVKQYSSMNDDNQDDNNDDHNNNNNNNKYNPKINTQNLKTKQQQQTQHTIQKYNNKPTQQQSQLSYKHEYIPSLIDQQQLQQNYSFTHQQKFILDQIQHLKHILQDKKDRQQFRQLQQQGDNMVEREKMIKKDLYIQQIKGSIKQSQIEVTEKKKQKQMIDMQKIRNIKDTNDIYQTMRKNKNINRTQIKGTLIQKLNEVDQIKSTKSKQSMQNTYKSNYIKNLPQTVNNNNIYNQSQHLSYQLQKTKQRQLILQQTLVQLKQSISLMRKDLYSLLPCQYCGLRGQLMQVL